MYKVVYQAHLETSKSAENGKKLKTIMPVSQVLQVRREQMMHQNIRFNFLFNLDDDGKKS